MANTISNRVNIVTQDLITKLSGKDEHMGKLVIDNVFSFVGLAGGVGTSTLLANVAKLISTKKLSVLIIDLNICNPVQQIYFSAFKETKSPDLVSLLTGEDILSECILYKDNISLLYAHNRILFDKVVLDSSIASTNFSGLISQVSSLFDVVLIDIPSQGELNHELSNVALYKSDYIVSVMNENVSCVGAISRMQKNLSYVGIPSHNMKIVMNMRSNINYPKSVFSTLGVEVEAILPYDIAVVESGLRGTLFIQKGASTAVTASQFANSTKELARLVLHWGGYTDESENKKKKREEKRQEKQNKKGRHGVEVEDTSLDYEAIVTELTPDEFLDEGL